MSGYAVAEPAEFGPSVFRPPAPDHVGVPDADAVPWVVEGMDMADMQITGFTQISLQGADVTSIAALYASWVIGAKDFEKARAARLTQGVPKGASVDELVAGTDIGAAGGTRIRSRAVGPVWLLHWSHGDDRAEGAAWHNIVKLRENGPVVHVQHLTAFAPPPGSSIVRHASASNVTKLLIERFTGRIEPKEVRKDARPVTIHAGDADDYVRHILLDEARSNGLVVVSTTRNDVLVQPQRLSDRLVGMASVVRLADDAAGWAWSEALERRKIIDLGCYGGAVRLYEPHLLADPHPGSHRLIVPWRIDEIPDRERAERVTTWLVNAMSRRVDPHSWMSVVAEIDIAAWRARAAAPHVVLDPVPAGPSDAGLRAAIEARDAEIRRLEKEVAEATKLVDGVDSEIKSLKGSVKVEHDRAETLKWDLEEARFEVEQQKGLRAALQAELDKAKAAEIAGLPADLRAAMAGVLMGKQPTPEQTLLMVAAAHGASVVVLPTAVKSARDSVRFKYGNQLAALLAKLAGPYREALLAGGDAEARKVFGKNEFAATESETIMTNKEARRARQFPYKGETMEMLSHLKIGVKYSVEETIRIHFHWDAEDEVIVIGYCGEHRRVN